MDTNTAKEVASAMRYREHASPLTVSTHEPEMLIEVVDGPEHHRSTPRQRDHSGACQIEIDVLQHHNPKCDEATTLNIKDLGAENIQGSYILIERFPVGTCKTKHAETSGVAPVKSALKKPTHSGSVPTPASKFSMHDDHPILHGSRKGTRLNDPDLFDRKPSPVRSTIENVALLPKLGCSQPNFVARMDQKLAKKNRYDPSANPAALQKTTPTMVNQVDTCEEKSPFHTQVSTSKHPSSPQVDALVYSADTGKSKSPFDPCMDPTLTRKSNDHKSHTTVTSVYTSKTKLQTPFVKPSKSSKREVRGASPSNQSNSNEITITQFDSDYPIHHTCANQDSRGQQQRDDKLVYKRVDGCVLPPNTMPFTSDDRKQSVYAVVSKSSRVSFNDKIISEEKCIGKKPSNVSQGIKSANFSIRGVTYETFKDPCFVTNEEKGNRRGSIVMTTKVRPPILPREKINNEVATMTSFVGCYAPTCDVQIIGKPRENFQEESGSEDELHVDSQQTVATDVKSQVDTVSKICCSETERQPPPPKEGCFKRVFLCGACRKKPADTHSEATQAVSETTSRKPSGYVPNGTYSSRGTSQRPASASSNRNAECSMHSHTPSGATGKSAKSHSKQGHNASPVYH